MKSNGTPAAGDPRTGKPATGEPADKYLLSLKAANLTEKTIVSAASSIDMFLVYLRIEKEKQDLREVTKQDIESFALYLRDRKKKVTDKKDPKKVKEKHFDTAFRHSSIQAQYKHFNTAQCKPLSSSYKNRILSTVKRFFSFLACEEYIMSDIACEIPLFNEEERIPRNILSEEEIRDFFNAVKTKNITGKRDFCLLKLLYHTGMRKGEVVNLELRDTDFKAGTLLVKEGKGGKDRVVPLGEKIQEELDIYLKKVRPYLVKSNPGIELVFTTNRGGKFSKNIISSMICEYAESAGIRKHITAHSFRHTFASHLLRRGANIRHIQEILGHEDLSTTQIYTRVVIKDLKAVYEKTHPRAVMKDSGNITGNNDNNFPD